MADETVNPGWTPTPDPEYVDPELLACAGAGATQDHIDGCEKAAAWMRWARGVIESGREFNNQLRAEKNILKEKLAAAEKSLAEHAEALKGMESMLRLRKGPQVFEPGADVLVGPDAIPGRVEVAHIQPNGQISYTVSFWVKGHPFHAVLLARDVKDADTPLPFRPGGETHAKS